MSDMTLKVYGATKEGEPLVLASGSQKLISNYLSEYEELFKDHVYQAFIAGQVDCGIDPSHASAQEYANKMFSGENFYLKVRGVK